MFDNEKFHLVTAKLEELDKEFREYGIPDRFKEKWGVSHNVGTWMIGRATGEFLYKKVVEAGAKNILEIGTSVGYSTLWLARGAEETGGRVITIEKEPYKLQTASEYWAEAGMQQLIDPILGDAAVELEGWNMPVNFLFIDANKRGYLPAFQKLEPSFTKGAMIVADNVNDMRDKMGDFLEYVQSHTEFKTEIVDIDHGILVAEKR